MNMHPRSARSTPLGSHQNPSVPSRRRTPLAKAILALAAASGLMVGLPGQAVAAVISYDYKTTLSYAFGAPDSEGLNGATVEFKVDVDAGARYNGYLGGASVLMNNDATLMISNASRNTNNATFALGQLAFLPGYAGVLAASGSKPTFFLADGTVVTLDFSQAATAHGSQARFNDLIDVRDFAPTTSNLSYWFAGNAIYNQTNVIIIASLPSTSVDSPPSPAAVPEPASVALFGIGSEAALGAVRRRRAA